MRLCCLDRADRTQRLIQPGKHESTLTISARQDGVNWKMDKMTRDQTIEGADYSGTESQPPVTLMWRLTLGRLCLRSMMKSWPFGFKPLERSRAALSRSSSAEARSGLRKSEASSWPRQVCNVPVQVIRTRLQDSQKLWVMGVMKPSFPPVSLTRTYRAGPPVSSSRSASVYRLARRARNSDSGTY